jgi:hypothetical protein
MLASVDFIRSPTALAWGIFWFYILFAVLGGYQLLTTFRQERIIYGHLDELFRFLTNIRIWSIRYRKTYIVVITALLGVTFLVLVYSAEILHLIFFQNQPVFSGVIDYLRWITVFVISGLQVGEYPQSLLGFILAGVFPVVVIGSVLTIVRVTSEGAHEALVKRMAEGEIAPHRVIVFNYREEYDEFVKSLLDESQAFVVIFTKEDHLQDAESFVEGIERTDTREYRIAIERLSYSVDVLFDQYSVLQSDEIYIFPDAESRTDYENLRLITRLNEEVKGREQNPNRAVDPPDTVWMADSRKLSGVAQNLEQTGFKRRLHALNFQADVRDLIRANTGDTIPELETYFNFTAEPKAPEWVEGFTLDNYVFHPNPLQPDEKETLERVREQRQTLVADSRTSIQQSQLAATREQALEMIEKRLTDEIESGPADRIGLFFGVLTEVASSTIPIDLSSAFLSQQIETATDAIQIRKSANVSSSSGVQGTSDGNVFIVNYNSKIKDFVLSFDDYESETDRYLTVFTSKNQITPDSTERTNFAEYRSMEDLLEMLFNETDRSPRRVESGDTIILLLDYTISNPKINVLRALDAIDDKLSMGSGSVAHNDIFLAVESDIESGNEEYRYLAVDKVFETQRTQRLFLNNLVQLRTSDVVRQLLQEGKLDQREAFNWAVDTAYYFKEFKIDSHDGVHRAETDAEAAIHRELKQLVDEHRGYDRRSALPFTTFSLRRDEELDMVVDLDELKCDSRIEEGQFLLSFPRM